MNAVVFDRFGEPDQVLSVRDVPIPEPGPGEVRVRMIASPVNPSDLLVVRGLYGVLPKLPATPGFEGVGVVDKVGGGLLGWLVKGKRVTVINGAGGNWAEYVVIPAKQARPVKADIPDEQVASFFVNPVTVLAMVRKILKVPQGQWLLQTAAGSELGKMVIRLAKHDGIKTINVVRRRDAMDELKTLGGDAVISTEDGPIEDQVRKIVGGDGVRYALDPVGGDTGTGAFNSLASEGRLIVYGTLTGEPIRIDSRRMIAGKRVVEGFWLGYWMKERSIPESLRIFHEVGNLIRANVLSTEVGKKFPITQIIDAVHEAERPGRKGKVLLDLTKQS
ncbi:MAG: Zn-dependent oxidoreductase, NADPH:quinone reductase [Planctomycetota bacterium]|nr:Zn-dependent oxidoreductase, NADPH:quinone reductase [Planctomycetota bacterium]